MERIEITENGMFLVFEIADDKCFKLLSSFNYEGIDKEGTLPADKKLKICIPHNGWQKEVNWKTYDLCDFDMERIQPACDQRSSNLLTVSNTGNWSAKEHLPMGYLENTDTHTGMLWQIENNGSWHWEIGDQNGHLYLAASGPNETYSHWFKKLEPGDTFTSVPVAVSITAQDFSHSPEWSSRRAYARALHTRKRSA